jgi:hypothetical protein
VEALLELFHIARRAFGGALRGRDCAAQPKRAAEGFDGLRFGA